MMWKSVVIASLVGCVPELVPPVERGPAEDGADTDEPEVEFEPIGDVAWVTRASLELRGVRPSVADLERAAAGEADDLVDGYVLDDRLGRRLAWLYNDHIHTALFFDNSTTRDWIDLTGEERHAVGWEPLALVEHVVNEDLPVTALVTAAQLLRNDAIANVFEWTPPGSGSAWVLAPFDDGRPGVGLLSSSALWFVYDGDATNYNRRRAALVARAFVCSDFLERDLVFDGAVDLSNANALETAVSTQAACQTCHSGLDPIASLMGGFVERSVADSRPKLGRYSAQLAEWTEASRSTGWFGRPVGTLGDLGSVIAEDPRFTRCAVQTFSTGLLGGTPADPDTIDGWSLAFAREDGLVLRRLAARVVGSRAYRDPAGRTLTTELLRSAIADLVGLPADDSLLDPLEWSTDHRLLGGGTDDATVVIRVRTPSVGHALLLQWSARAVAGEALARDAERDAEDRVLWTVAEPWSDTQVAAQVAVWHSRFLSTVVAEEDPRAQALVQLWEDAGGAAAPETAWEAVIHALLRHPLALVY